MLYNRPKAYPFLLAIGLMVLLLGSCFKERRSDKAAVRMKEFVQDISDYARGFDPDFIIIPQNGVELAFANNDPADGPDVAYTSRINGLGVEELFYNGGYQPDQERIDMLEKLKLTHTVMVSEFVDNDQNVDDAHLKNAERGFLSFVRGSANYDYAYIPPAPVSENSDDITNLNEVRNYLYLINAERYADKHTLLADLAATNYDAILMDVFYEQEPFTAAEIEQLKTKANGGKRLVIAYMNIGSAEKFRYYWKKGWGLHHPLWLKKKYDGYDDEFWVKFWKEEWQSIIYGNNDSYTKKILDAGFDGAYLDNAEAYYFLYYKD